MSSRALALAVGLVTAGALAASPVFAHGRPVHRAAPTMAVRMATIHIKGRATKVFTTGKGLTLYYAMGVTSAKDFCKGKCAALWPPFTVPTHARLIVPKGIKGFAVGTSDGRRQLLFKGHPLFVFYKDHKAGQALGEGLFKIWWVATPALKPAWVHGTAKTGWKSGTNKKGSGTGKKSSGGTSSGGSSSSGSGW